MAFLRACSIFIVCLLLLNPKTEKKNYQNQKAPLQILVDCSSSIAKLDLESQQRQLIKAFENSNLADKFELQYYAFGSQLTTYKDSLADQEQTNIYEALQGIQKINDNLGATVLITDGNQTYGTDYSFFNGKDKQHIYSLVLGDTTKIEDLRIDKVYANKYAFLKNKYPLEVYIFYQGKNTVNSKLRITKGGVLLSEDNIVLHPENNSLRIEKQFLADKVGVQNIRFELLPLDGEKNKQNNISNLRIEVINEKSKIGIISDFPHPDIAALQRTILSNEQREVHILYPEQQSSAKLDDFAMFVLYQPGMRSRRILEKIASLQKACFVITGPKTNWGVLRKLPLGLQASLSKQSEDYQAELDNNFNLFSIGREIHFSNYPPLKDYLGEKIITNSFQTILQQKINGIRLAEPLLAIYTQNQHKNAVLFGENFWQWRMHAYQQNGSFATFDQFFSKLLFLLQHTSDKSRLNVKSESYYYQNSELHIEASYYNTALEFDSNAKLRLKLYSDTLEREYTMQLKGGYYGQEIHDLAPGEYTYTVVVEGENLQKKGSFSVIPFDVEAQFVRANYEKLDNVAQRNHAKVYLAQEQALLLEELEKNDAYQTIQTEIRNIVPLIDYRWLLVLLAISLSSEWFIRKFIGLN
ncbi:MAG: VWA domain-containing protein [Flavobacteriaceae bacterium]|nr:VWA domain-containing protein [Flavobacteriaceae bacterium]